MHFAASIVPRHGNLVEKYPYTNFGHHGRCNQIDYSPDSYMQAARDNIDLGQLSTCSSRIRIRTITIADLECRREGIAHGLQHPMHIYGNGTVMHHTRAAIGRFEGQRYQFHLLRRMRPLLWAMQG